MSFQKTYKRGEFLFKDGDKIQSFIFIQSGGVSQCSIKGKKNIELFQLGSNQFLGETALLGQQTHTFSAMATSETKTLEVPAETIKAQYDTAPQFIKMMLRSLADRLKLALAEVKSNKQDKDATPCPDEVVPQIFASIFHTMNHKGEKLKDGKVEIKWQMLRQYTQRVLGQSPKRVEQALNILVKLKQGHFNMGKSAENPEGPEEIQEVVLYDLGIVEGFYEYFQYYFYKPGKTDFLKYDDFVAQLTGLILKQSESETPDRFGVLGIDYSLLAEAVKEELGVNLLGDHFTRLENKGIMTKRRALENKQVRLELEVKEVKHTFYAWKILREIDKWNEKGFVDIHEKEEKKKKPNENACPQCGTGTQPQQKFCGDCGFNLLAVKAS
jgi:DNA-binding transcriptional ArsR family regulator